MIHAKGTGMEGAAQFLGVELVNEKELVLIVARTPEKNRIMTVPGQRRARSCSRCR